MPYFSIKISVLVGVGVAEEEVLALLVHDEYRELLLVTEIQLPQNTRQVFISLRLSMSCLFGGPRDWRVLLRDLGQVGHRSLLLRLNFSLLDGLFNHGGRRMPGGLRVPGGLLRFWNMCPGEDAGQVVYALLGVVEYFWQPGLLPHLGLAHFLFGSYPLCETDAYLPPTHAGLAVVLAPGPFPRLGRGVGHGHRGRFAIVIMERGGGERFYGHTASFLLALPLSPAGLGAFAGIVDDLEGLFGRTATAAFGQPTVMGFFVTVAKHEWQSINPPQQHITARQPPTPPIIFNLGSRPAEEGKGGVGKGRFVGMPGWLRRQARNLLGNLHRFKACC